MSRHVHVPVLWFMVGPPANVGMIRETYSTPREDILQIESTTIVGGKSETCIQVSAVHGAIYFSMVNASVYLSVWHACCGLVHVVWHRALTCELAFAGVQEAVSSLSVTLALQQASLV